METKNIDGQIKSTPPFVEAPTGEGAWGAASSLKGSGATSAYQVRHQPGEGKRKYLLFFIKTSSLFTIMPA